jgi:hypothetical protein
MARLTGARTVLTTLAAAILLVPAGCGGGDSTTAEQSPSARTPVEESPAKSPKRPAPIPAGEMSGPQRNLEASGYSVSALTEPQDLENVVQGSVIVAAAGIAISGKGVHHAVGYAFDRPAEAKALLRSIPGLASSMNGNRLYFVGERAPNQAFDRMVGVAER